MSEMELSIALNVALGIVLFALLRRQSGDDGVRLHGNAEAVRIFMSQFPDLQGAASVADDGRGALIELESGGGVGLLERRGRRWNARVIRPGDLASAPTSARIEGECLCIGFADFGWPRSRLRFGDAGARSTWLARLGAAVPSPPGRQRDPRHA